MSFREVTLAMYTYQELLYLTSGVPAFGVKSLPDEVLHKPPKHVGVKIIF
jgi:hypothetical protein